MFQPRFWSYLIDLVLLLSCFPYIVTLQEKKFTEKIQKNLKKSNETLKLLMNEWQIYNFP